MSDSASLKNCVLQECDAKSVKHSFVWNGIQSDCADQIAKLNVVVFVKVSF